MSDETKVPPGWVRLTRGDDGEAVLMRANRIEVVEPHCVIADDGVTLVTAGAKVWVPTDVLPFVTESPAEVAALIAAAEAAERRATVVAVVTSPSQGDAIVAVTADGTCWAPSEGRMQPVIAGIDLDDIERREVADG